METQETTEPAVMVDGLTKRYGGRAVADGLDFAVPRGAVAGLVGPNGAGKTTVLRMLLGLVRPDAGFGSVNGISLLEPERYLPTVGALVESPAFYPGLTGERNLAVHTTLAGLDPARIPAVLDRLGLTRQARQVYRTYSLGQRQRLAIAAALLGDPALVVLDEPTNGLDPAGIRDMRGIIRAIGAEGRTVLVTSHLLAELEQVCDWLIVLNEGRVRYSGRLLPDLEESYFQMLQEDPR
ncbi:ABC transporter ATP-binding protein [Dactylosporangium sp. NPDC051541]|uniref:ABC transporter ATP-binding protein n=1 Tax=Dactylosporangium sp. NPDC051541 TaxID=3363977 RepID=UPI00379A00A1